MRRGPLHLAAVLALAVALAGPVPAARAAGSSGNGAPLSWSSLKALWSWLINGVSPQPSLQLTCERGIHIDPDGGCTAAALAPVSDRGSHIDPNG